MKTNEAANFVGNADLKVHAFLRFENFGTLEESVTL